MDVEKIYDNNNLLHIIRRYFSKKTFMTEETDFLGVNCYKFEKDKVVQPHYHLSCNKIIYQNQEVWMVYKGKIEVSLYDLSNKKIKQTILCDGDILITLKGAHSLKVLEENTIIYEIKTGPYLGPEKDRVCI
tara:strand:+ start:1546 stop:1941 length:396 start_codon:yes stop_codon:yes gene_type:complete